MRASQPRLDSVLGFEDLVRQTANAARHLVGLAFLASTQLVRAVVEGARRHAAVMPRTAGWRGECAPSLVAIGLLRWLLITVRGGGGGGGGCGGRRSG